MPETDEDIAVLRRCCDFAAFYWNCVFSALTLAALRLAGPAALDRLWFELLGRHQTALFTAGLRKLGIAGDPPAVAAAKYHYLSNLIGGLSLEYVEETPRKAWIRYLPPNWSYPDTALVSIPAGVRRTVFSTWHPRNGELMGCPRLGWVVTKLMDEGDVCDEGYFIEHDRDLAPDERCRFEPVDRSPEFDPGRAPGLDPAIWPESRLLRAKRRYAGGYVAEAMAVLHSTLDADQATAIAAHARRVLANQYVHDIATRLGVAGGGARNVAAVFAGILDACDQDCSLEAMGPDEFRIVLRSFRPFAALRWPCARPGSDSSATPCASSTDMSPSSAGSRAAPRPGRFATRDAGSGIDTCARRASGDSPSSRGRSSATYRAATLPCVSVRSAF